MSRRTQWYLAGGLVTLLAGTFVAASRLRPPEPVDVGSNAPDVRAKTVDGAAQIKHLSDYRGQVILLNIWATWCDPCRREMPSIERLYRELGPRGLKVVAVSIDDAGAEDNIRDFARELGLTFEILHDPTGDIQRAYQLVGVPESFVIDQNGVIQQKAFESDWYAPQNRTLVAKLLGSS
jgi:peroxiredoxin